MADIRVGKAQVRIDRTAHVRGVRQGNNGAGGGYKRQPGHLPGDLSAARRSSGINPGPKNPILPGMPNLSPA